MNHKRQRLSPSPKLVMSRLKPHDVAVALQLALEPGSTFRRLAEALGMSRGEMHNAVKRLVEARLASPESRTVYRSRLLDLLTGGVPYVFAAAPGAETRGVPTAHAAPPLNDHFPGTAPFVWPDAQGTVRGQAVTPLYPGAPGTAQRNPALYEALALVDAVRVGQARERELALQLLRSRLQVDG